MTTTTAKPLSRTAACRLAAKRITKRRQGAGWIVNNNGSESGELDYWHALDHLGSARIACALELMGASDAEIEEADAIWYNRDRNQGDWRRVVWHMDN